MSLELANVPETLHRLVNAVLNLVNLDYNTFQ